MEWEPKNADKDASWELYIKLLTKDAVFIDKLTLKLQRNSYCIDKEKNKN